MPRIGNDMTPTKRGLQVERTLDLLRPGGALARVIPSFETREAQLDMLRQVLNSYNDNSIALIEAGTGTGKSLAYLIPAILWALQERERTVIATHTIALQEQLVLKDIPLLLKSLQLDAKVVLAKGMNHYLCLRKFHELSGELNLWPVEEAKELQIIESWRHTAVSGSKSELPFVPSFAVWEQLCAEADVCNHTQCPHFKECFFFKARQESQEAHLIIANHHLLFADLQARAETGNYDGPAILAPYKRIVFDEAHHIEDIATEFFAAKVSQLGMMKHLSRLSSEKQGKEQGKLLLLKNKLGQVFKGKPSQEIASLQQRLSLELPALRQRLLEYIVATFQSVGSFLQRSGTGQREETARGEQRLRLRETHYRDPFWREVVQPNALQLREAVGSYTAALQGLDNDIEAVHNDKLSEETKDLRFDIKALGTRLEHMAETLSDCVSKDLGPQRVQWIESDPPSARRTPNVHLINAQLEVAPSLVQHVFQPFSTVILCSATLTTNRHFSFIKQRLGLAREELSQRPMTENILASPFDYRSQVLFAVPSDAPPPTHPDFLKALIQNSWKAIQASRGNAFLLFTSFGMLDQVHRALVAPLQEQRYVVFKQGQESSQALLQRFRTTPRAVLFGADSFWEGVDVVGDALRCVIIAKLPFKVPSEPIVEARSEALTARGQDPFLEYSVPSAIVKFKQGCGRLIRNRHDRGCIVCLDNRILKKPYGKLFLNSFPTCQYVFVESDELEKSLRTFYSRRPMSPERVVAAPQ